MKKFLIYTLGLAAAATALTACSNEQDDVFGSTAAERLNETNAATREVLTSKPNGWALQMFTTEREPGYTFLCNFDKNGAVKIAANHKWIGGNYAEETSLFDMIADNGPVLSFSSYNTIFHILATPEDFGETSINEQGYGHKGDYEFIIMDAKPDRILLKGKKWGQKAILTALPEDADWQSYLTGLKSVQNSMFSSKLPQLKLVTPQGNFILTHADFGYFYVVAEGGDMVSETSYVPFAVSEGKLTLWAPFTGLEKVAGQTDYVSIAPENFKLDAEGCMRCTDEGNEKCYIVSHDIATLLTTPQEVMTLVDNTKGNFNPSVSHPAVVFNLDLDSFSPVLAAAYKKMYDQIVAGNSKMKKGQRVRNVALSYNYDLKSLTLLIETQNYKGGGIKLDVTFGPDGQFVVSDTGTGIGNSVAFYNAFTSVAEFVDLLCGTPLTFTSDSRLIPNNVKVETGTGESFTMGI